MKKRLLKFGFLLMLLTIFIPVAVFASTIENRLNESHRDVYAGSNFEGINTFYLNNPLNIANLDIGNPIADFSFWHFVDTSGESESAIVIFKNSNNEEVSWKIYPSGGGQHYAVITPSSWKLMDGISYSNSVGNFNLSHSGRHEATMGKVRVTASVDPYYYEITPHKYYERTIDNYYQRTVDKYFVRSVSQYYKRTIDEYYERTSVDIYEREITDVYQRYAQRYLVPTFMKKFISMYGTLVTRLEYSGDTKRAVPTNGGAFINGHTYVKVEVEEASSEEGIWFTIADSSPNNGKKAPNQYNRPIPYRYNVKIHDDKLTISFDDDLISASVGAYVVLNPNKFPGNAPKHYLNTVTVDLPNGYGAYVYLYTHIESLKWYTNNGEYEFVSWIYDEPRTEYFEYEKIATITGAYVYKRTEYGSWVLVDTVEGEYNLINTVYGDPEFVREVFGPWELINTVEGQYVLYDEDESKEKINIEYTGLLTLMVNGIEKPLNENFYLLPGDYELTLSGTGGIFEPITKNITIVVGDNDTIIFNNFNYTLDDVILPDVNHYRNMTENRHEENLIPTNHVDDAKPKEYYSDAPATRHEETLAATREDRDIITAPIYNPDYIYRPDIYLGDEVDPYGLYAIRLN